MLNPFTHRKVLKNGVPGKATIVSMGALNRGGTSFNLPMTLQVYVEGWTPYEVEDQWMVKAKDTIGLSGWIPVRVDPDERDKVAIDWDGVRANHEAQEEARRQALARRGPVTGLGTLGGSQVNVTYGDPQEIDLTNDPEAAQQVMQMLGQFGVDLQGPASAGAPAADDPIARLERLGQLRASGVLTEEEFQAQKAKILRET